MTGELPPFRPTTKDDVAWLGDAPAPAKAYYDPDYFELKREAVFGRTWLQVGHVCELPDPGCFIRRDMGLASGAIPHINFQVHEALCRHLFNSVDAMVRDYQGERGA